MRVKRALLGATVAALALIGQWELIRGAGRGIVVDTYEDIWPDPRERQAVYLGMLSRRLQAYARDHGALPGTLDAVAESELRTDLWGEPVRYEPAGEVFTLRSAGPDRVLGTDDDLAGEEGTTYASKRRLYERARDSALRDP